MRQRSFRFLLSILLFFGAGLVPGFSQGNSGSLSGLVTDSSGALLPNATVRINNPVSGYTRSVTADAAGQWRLYNVPFNSYRVTATATGFTSTSQSVDLNSVVPVSVSLRLGVEGTSTVVNVESTGDLVENDATMHTDIDRSTIDKLPLESASSELSSIVTLASPGVAADSNGLFHGLGDHAENSFSVDGQPSPTNRARSSQTSCPPMPCNRSRSSTARRRPSSATRPAS